MSKNLEELKEHNEDNFFEGLGLQNFTNNYIIPILEDFEKRISEIERRYIDLWYPEHHEINETGGVNNIKIILNDPKLKKKEK